MSHSKDDMIILNRSVRFFAVEKITFLYLLITSVIILILLPKLSNAYELLGTRLTISLIIISLAYLNSIRSWWVIRLSRYAFLGALLSLWYPETYEINRVLPNFDFLVAGWEQHLFGCQPALLFCQHFKQWWFSELLNMGYFSYYPLIIGTSLYFFFTNRKYFEYFFFTVLFSFFCYYLIYILFPVAGPQYYFPVAGVDNISAGLFPNVGHYFNTNNTLLSSPNNSGIFFQMVENTQQLGERPTAAFPSSHVGISTIIMLLVIKKRRYVLFGLLTPLYLSLVAATVYIQAHYAIDVIAGLATAVAFFFLGSAVHELFTRQYFGVPEFSALFLKDRAH